MAPIAKLIRINFVRSSLAITEVGKTTYVKENMFPIIPHIVHIIGDTEKSHDMPNIKNISKAMFIQKPTK